MIIHHNLSIRVFDLSLSTIGVFVGIALIYRLLIPARWRKWTLFLLSIILIYRLQPDIFVRWLDFFFPTVTLSLTVASWYLTRADEQSLAKQDVIALGLINATIIGLALLRFVDADFRWLVASRPPPLHLIVLLVLFTMGITFSVNKLSFRYTVLLLSLLAIFIVLKTEIFAIWTSQLIRTGTGQDVSQAAVIDLNWLGFSYLAFRLIHTIRDRQSGLLPVLSLQEYVSYVVFFPALIAGPIDRAERFITDFRALIGNFDFQARYIEGLTRISIGIFKKFVMADTLAQGMALDPINATQLDSTPGTWILLYGYSLRLFFDFSGYSDIAIGIGILFGIKLPENFAQPYTRTNITKFWQSWHITLSNWVRFYVFSPLSRYLLKRKPKPSPVLIVLISQLTTMIVIALWHGVTVNFFIWGIWHGIGLFIHKQWTDKTRHFYRELKENPRQHFFADGIAWFITFHFVVLGWVWFAIPDFEQSLFVFMKLFGLS